MSVKRIFSDAKSVYTQRIENVNRDREKFPEQMYGIHLGMSLSEINKCENRLHMLSEAHSEPVSAGKKWLYQDAVYEVIGNYSDNEKKLLILEYADKERQKFERLAAKFSKEQSENIKYERTRIPECVRIEVWRRDQGKCARCGSRVNLEYDHIVPISRGGSNTARNVGLLCQDCNRSKSNKIQ